MNNVTLLQRASVHPVLGVSNPSPLEYLWSDCPTYLPSLRVLYVSRPHTFCRAVASWAESNTSCVWIVGLHTNTKFCVCRMKLCVIAVFCLHHKSPPQFWYSYAHSSECSSFIVQSKSRADCQLCTVGSVVWLPERSLGTQHWNLSSWKWLWCLLVGEKYSR